MSNKYLISTAIPYANGAPHIGHAYERIATDVMARFRRLDGDDVLFITGMDEHGQKMQQTAAREGLTPQGLADRTAAQFEAMGELLNARADDIVRTTSQRHKDSVTEIWKRMEAAGDIYLSKYAGWYSVRDEAYYGEDEIEEREGRRFSIKTNTLVEWVEEESYFFKLSAYAKPLLEHYTKNPDFIVPEQYRNEIIGYAQNFTGLRYRYAGRSPKTGFDCSGFTNYILGEFNVKVSACSRTQSTQGVKIALNEVLPGDLIFFGRPGRIQHVALVVEHTAKGIICVHSTSSRGIVVENISTSKYWKPKILFARDVINGPAI